MNGLTDGAGTGGVDGEIEARSKRFPRWRIACINWSHADAPKAASYYIDGDKLCDMYFATWAEAVKWTDTITRRPTT